MVVLPTYNEADNLPNMVAALLSCGVEDLSVLVVDDNSPDGTGELAEQLKAGHPESLHVIHRPGKMGLGTAYVTGFKYALAHGAERIVQMDADFSHDPACLPVFMRLMDEQGYDVIIGSRYVPGGKLDADWGRWRRFLSAFGNRYATLITGMRLRDVTSGFKCFAREALAGLDLDRISSNGYAFQIEVNYACWKAGYRIHEEPITFADRVLGHSKMSSAIILEAMWRVWQMRWPR